MARLRRLSLAGEAHQVLLRGHGGRPVFLDEQDRRDFLSALRDAARGHGVAVHAYVLLDAQVALVVTPATDEGLGRAMQALGRRYVAAFNRRHGRRGTLWDGRFCAAVIESERYLLDAMVLTELQPVQAGLAVGAAAWPWSSAAHHLGMARDPLVHDHSLYWALGNTPFDREASYRRRLEQGVPAATAQALADAADKNWTLGSPAFLARLADRTDRPLTARPRGRPRKQPVAL